MCIEGCKIYFTDEELKQVLIACENYGLQLGESDKYYELERAADLILEQNACGTTEEYRKACKIADKYSKDLASCILSKLRS